MSKRVAFGFLSAVGLAAAICGCAPTQMATNTGQRNGKFYGDYGITGDGNTTQIERDSLINKLSIIGDNNHVVVEDNVALAKIEIWGSGNDIELPYGLNPTFTQVSRKGNNVYNRPAPWETTGGRRGAETTRTTTVIDYDENSGEPPTITTTSENPSGTHGAPPPAKPAEPAHKPRGETPTSPDAIP